MPYVLRLSDKQHERLGKARYPKELRCDTLGEFLFKSHQIMTTLKQRGYDTSNYMWYRTTNEDGVEIVDISQLVWTDPYPPREKDSGWG